MQTKPQSLSDPKKLEIFLKAHSQTYKNVFSIKEIAKGGESIVSRLETKELEELVVKVPNLENSFHKNSNQGELAVF